MLITKIRTGIKSPIAKGFLFFFFIALFGGFGITELIRRVMGGKTDSIAMINGEEISKNYFAYKHQEAKELINFYYNRFGKSASMLMSMQGINQNTEESAFDTIVQETLLNQIVKKIPVYLSPEYVAAKLQDPHFLISQLYHLMPSNVINYQNNVNLDIFNQFMASFDLTPYHSELVAALEREMALTLMANAFWIPQYAVQEKIENLTMERRFSIATFPLDAALKKAESEGVSAQDLKSFFDEQNDKNKRYYIPAKRNGTKWVFALENFNIKIGQKEIESFYNKVKRARFVETPTKVKIREIILDDVKNKGLHALKAEIEEIRNKALADPSKFAELAKQYSKAQSTAANGGLVDFFERGKKNKAIEQAAFRLKANNDISEIIQIENGYALIQRVDRKETVFKPLEKVKNEVINLLKVKKFNTEFVKAATKVTRTQSDDAAEKFKAFVEKYKGVEEKVPAAQKNESPVAERLFSLKKKGDKIAYMNDGKGVILELNDILKKNLPPYDMLLPYVKKDYFMQKAQTLLAEEINAAKKKAFKNGKLEAPEGGKIEKTEWISIKSNDKLKKLFEKGIPQDIMLLDKKGGVISSIGQKEGFIIRLDELKNPTAEPKKEELAGFESSIKKQLEPVFMSSFIASLNRNATIETYTSSDRRNENYDI